MKNSRRNMVALLALVALSLTLIAPAAYAQSSRDGYVEQGPSTLNQVGGGGNTPPPQQSSGGELPFTGLDVGLIAIAGASLVLLGFGMRRLTRAPDAA